MLTRVHSGVAALWMWTTEGSWKREKVRERFEMKILECGARAPVIWGVFINWGAILNQKRAEKPEGTNLIWPCPQLGEKRFEPGFVRRGAFIF